MKAENRKAFFKRLGFLAVLILALIVASLFLYVHWFLNPSRFARFIERTLKSRSNIEVSIDEAKVSLGWGIGVNLRDITLLHPPKWLQRAEAQELFFRLRLLSLLRGEKRWDLLRIVSPVVEMNVGGGVPRTPSARLKRAAAGSERALGSLLFLATELNIEKLAVSNGRLILRGIAPDKAEEKIVLRRFHLLAYDLSLGRMCRFKSRFYTRIAGSEGQIFMTGNFKIPTGESPSFRNWELQAKVEGLSAEVLNLLTKDSKAQVENGKVKALLSVRSGEHGIEASASVVMEAVAIRYSDVFAKPLMLENASFEAVYSGAAAALSVKKLRASIGPFRFAGAASLKKVGPAGWSLRVDAELPDANAYRAVEYLRAHLKGKDSFLEDFLISGNIKNTSLSITASFRAAGWKIDTIRAAAALEAISIGKKGGAALSDLKGTVKYDGNILSFSRLTGTWDGIPWTAKGFANLRSNAKEFNVEVDLAVKMERDRSAVAGFMPEHLAALLDRHRLLIKRGDARILLNVRGGAVPIFKYDYDVRRCVLRNIELERIGSVGPLVLISADAFISGEQIIVRNFDLRLKGMDIQGESEAFLGAGELKKVRIRAVAEMTDGNLCFLLGEAWGGKCVVRGEAAVDLSGSLYKGGFGFSGHVDLKKAEFSYGDWFMKPRDLQAGVDLTGRFEEDRGLVLDEMIIAISGDGIEGKGHMFAGDGRSFMLDCNISKAELSEIGELFPRISAYFSSGLVEGGFHVEMREGAVRLGGSLNLENATVLLPEKSEIQVAKSFITFSERGLRISDTSIQVGGTKLKVHARIDLEPAGNKKLEFNLWADTVDLPSFLRPLFSPDRASLWFMDGVDRYSGSVRVDRILWNNERLDSFSAVLSGGNGSTRIEDARFKWGEGDVLLDLKFARQQAGGPYNFLLSFDLRRVDSRKVLRLLGSEGSFITARADLEGDINGLYMSSAGVITDSLNGRFSFKVHKGILYKFRLLSKIFGLLNLSVFFKGRLPDLTTEGMAFKKITATGRLENGVLWTEDLFVDGYLMKMLLVGDMDFPHGTMDFKMGIQPLFTLDFVLSNLPLVGRILTGEDKRLLALYYEIKGPIDDPVVRSTNLQSFGEGISGIFQRALLTPVDMLKMLDELAKKAAEKRKK